ncbi:ead/Ea22-like family protein [Escherichia coli]|nr:ead/Ea22-like family protein [Escherichia coli]EJZ1891967.1 ead/Ea22-like family protein [Escherichia coli]ELJ3862947.1 ead/Ea22-like family protein [Escherichia coli]
MTALNKQALREAAEKATPGRVGDRIDGSGSIKYECHGYDGSLVLRTDHKNMEYGFIGDNSNADELFFRLCVPDVILALLDELEAAEKRIAEQQSAIIAPGIMRCAGCGFVLTKNSINMAAGTITAGDSKTEPCPNGCGPLWPVTWKEQALQMRDDSEQWFIELQQAKNRIAELEARTVKLPEYRNSPDMHTKQFYEAIGFNQGLDVFIEALRAAGIGVKGE